MYKNINIISISISISPICNCAWIPMQESNTWLTSRLCCPGTPGHCMFLLCTPMPAILLDDNPSGSSSDTSVQDWQAQCTCGLVCRLTRATIQSPVSNIEACVGRPYASYVYACYLSRYPILMHVYRTGYAHHGIVRRQTSPVRAVMLVSREGA